MKWVLRIVVVAVVLMLIKNQYEAKKQSAEKNYQVIEEGNKLKNLQENPEYKEVQEITNSVEKLIENHGGQQ